MPKIMPLKQRFMQFVIHAADGCWLWNGYIGKHGYSKIQCGKTSRLAHRVSWEIFHGPIPEGLNVLHKCDVTACVNPEHLFVGTQQENVVDMFNKRRGNRATGERNGRARLTATDVIQIRNDPRKRSEIARAYNMSWAHIDRLKRGQFWNHLQEK